MTRLCAEALLFDLDGTLINSLPAVERAWTQFAGRHGLDPALVLSEIHGRRSIDSIRRLLPDADADEEDRFIRGLESSDTRGVIPLPGSVEFLSALPKEKWAIVTSGTSDVARARCEAAGLPPAGAYVFGEDVANGKPHPDPFLLAANRLMVAPKNCVAFEDTEAGLKSIRSAGMRAVGVGLPSELSVRNFTEVEAHLDGPLLCIQVRHQ